MLVHPEKTVIEAGHFYVDQEVDTQARLSAVVGAYLWNLHQFGESSQRMLFIDDLVELSVNVSLPESIEHIKQTGFVPDVIVYESSLVPMAELILKDLERADKLKPNKKSGRLMFKEGWFPVTGKAGKETLPSCAVLDAALYLQKLAQFDQAVTVLSADYLKQQQQTQQILRHLGVVAPNVVLALISQTQESVIELDFQNWRDASYRKESYVYPT